LFATFSSPSFSFGHFLLLFASIILSHHTSHHITHLSVSGEEYWKRRIKWTERMCVYLSIFIILLLSCPPPTTATALDTTDGAPTVSPYDTTDLFFMPNPKAPSSRILSQGIRHNNGIAVKQKQIKMPKAAGKRKQRFNISSISRREAKRKPIPGIKLEMKKPSGIYLCCTCMRIIDWFISTFIIDWFISFFCMIGN
jgi:hypothetical protein